MRLLTGRCITRRRGQPLNATKDTTMPNDKCRRRDFLTASAVLGAAMAAPAVFSAEGRPKDENGRTIGPNDEIRTAILGIRNQGKNHIAYHQATPNVRIATLCDPDERLFAERVKLVAGGEAKTETDLRRVLDDKNIDCVCIAMPNYWHALATVWACQAGKDVYVEKPATYCIAEGRKMIEAGKKHNRIVQNGTQMRAHSARQEAMKLLRENVLGDVYMVRAFIYNPRESIGRQADGPVPDGVHYDLWMGPSKEQPFNPNRFHYNWHWFWETGNGEIGNNGPHLADLIIHGLDRQETLPVKIGSQGGRYVWNDQGETPNSQVTTYTYADGLVATLETRNLPSNKEVDLNEGAIFFGPKGYMVVAIENFHTVIDKKPGPKVDGRGAHNELVRNFYDVVRSRNKTDLLAPIEYGHTAAALCHLGNIAYRLGRTVEFDPKTETFPRDEAANALLTREYRKPYVMPDAKDL
jgi:predicted dehydrogenase